MGLGVLRCAREEKEGFMKLSKFEKRIWLSSPTMHGDEQRFVEEAFETNWVSTVGENITHLEKEVCQFLGCKSGVALSTGTAALHLAVKLTGLKPGEKVFCSDMTFAATANPVSYEQGEQVFVDNEYDTWNMDPLALERAFKIYPDTRVVIVANLYGTPAKFKEICAICDKHNAILIEDAAESLSATYRGRQTGTFGKYNVISFNGNKIITTSGGGMLCSEDIDAIAKAKFWSTQAREQYPWYQHEEIGHNYRMSNILAGIGRGQFLHLEEHRMSKKKIYMRYKEGLQGIPITMNPYLKCSEPNFWLSCIIIDKDYFDNHKVKPEYIRNKLESCNVDSRPIWKPMHLQPVFRDKEFISAEKNGDVSADIFERGLCLPSDIKMTEEEQDVIIDVIKDCFQ